jgi:hypothetical protein
LLEIVLSCFDLLVRELQSVYSGLHAFDGLLILGIAGYLYVRSRQRES